MVWGKPAAGAWADAVDEAEAVAPVAPPAPTAFLAGKARAADDDFPDLAAAAKVKESKKDKKKKESKNKQTLSLTDFLKSDVGGVGGGGGAFRPSRGGGLGGGGGGGSGGGDVDLLSLPTAPRPRVEGEERPERGMGGGFREYGGNREGGRGGRFGDDDERREGGDMEDMGPSRAEMSDNWGADRKFVTGGPSSGGDDRGRGGFGGGGGFREGGFREAREGGGGFRDRSREERGGGFPDGPSRADEIDDWGKTKAFVPSSGGGGRSGGFEDRREGGGGFRDRSPPAFREPSRADTEDRWSRPGAGAEVKPTAFEDRPRREYDDARPPRRGGFGFGSEERPPGDRDASRDRWERAPREVSSEARPHSRDLSQERVWRKAEPAGAGGGDGAPRGRPKLNLAPRSAAAPAEAGDGASKSSVFGAARPREEVLKEQGRDPLKEELAAEHAAVGRPESAEEKQLRQEILDLQVRVEAGEADVEYEGGEAAGEAEAEAEAGEGAEEAPAGSSSSKTVAQALEDLEGRLQRLQIELDTKAKYARADELAKEKASQGRAREPSPAGEAGWRRAGPEAGAADANGGSAAPRAFRDDRPAREPREARGGEERPPRRAGGYEERGRRERDSFPPPARSGGAGAGGDKEKARDGSRDKPRW